MIDSNKNLTTSEQSIKNEAYSRVLSGLIALVAVELKRFPDRDAGGALRRVDSGEDSIGFNIILRGDEAAIIGAFIGADGATQEFMAQTVVQKPKNGRIH